MPQIRKSAPLAGGDRNSQEHTIENDTKIPCKIQDFVDTSKYPILYRHWGDMVATRGTA